ncbi:MAG: MATE family efflux transporter [Ruminococcaceae bacterium]|nr:MATE family efflux transporter [Oscillospiraceae bacterium]
MGIKSTLIGTKEFYIRVITIVLPMIIQNTITNVVSLLDNIMIGRVGTLEMSAVAIVNQLLFVFMLCIFGGMAGAGIFATQYAGAKDTEGVRYCFRAKILIGFFMLVISLAVFLIFPNPLIKAYISETTTPAEAVATLGHAGTYLRIMLIGLLPFTITQIYASSLRELGETKLPMIASVFAILTNFIFNYLLIFGKFGFPKLGVAGAAIATVMSRFVEALIIAIAVAVKRNQFTFIIGAFKSLYIPLSLCKKILTKGMPLLVNEFLWSLGMAILLQCYSVRGIQVVAAVNISNTVNNLFNVVFLTMGNAVAIIIGQHLGANQIEEAKKAIWQLLSLAVATCLVMGTLMAAIAPLVPKIYNTQEEVREMATSFLLVVALMMPIFAFAHNCYFALRSGGRTLIIFLFDSAFTWGLVVPTAFILSKYTALPILLVFFLVQALELGKCIIGFFMIKKGIWIQNIIK